ncbi:shikimate dehydrogenase [Leptolyngbya sp. 'hensonii']|nr:shikimate dehydrogenase [Leptolyngbya sp. 'hensonii']
MRGTTRLLGVIGDPIQHSLSPVMHNAAIADLGVDYVYLPFHVKPSDLTPAIKGFEAIGVQGFSITLPHKQTILPLLTRISETAQAIGAVNTVWWTDQGWSGTNTDVEGFIAPLKSEQRDWANLTAVILGNGGAARAVVAGCALLGCQQIRVVGRNAPKLSQFVESWQQSPFTMTLTAHPWADLPTLLPEAGLVVNATPIGMAPQTAQSPLSADLIGHLTAGAIAYDLIYTPRPTRFLEEAQAQGAAPIDGLEMLVQQGAAALQIWLQQPAPADIMRAALLDHLAHR